MQQVTAFKSKEISPQNIRTWVIQKKPRESFKQDNWTRTKGFRSFPPYNHQKESSTATTFSKKKTQQFFSIVFGTAVEGNQWGLWVRKRIQCDRRAKKEKDNRVKWKLLGQRETGYTYLFTFALCSGIVSWACRSVLSVSSWSSVGTLLRSPQGFGSIQRIKQGLQSSINVSSV